MDILYRDRDTRLKLNVTTSQNALLVGLLLKATEVSVVEKKEEPVQDTGKVEKSKQMNPKKQRIPWGNLFSNMFDSPDGPTIED